MAAQEIREPTFLILATLGGGAVQHGYAIMREIETMSDGRVVMRAGTLYAALDRLLTEGLVDEAGTEIVDSRLRRYYTITEEGVSVLDAEVSRMRANAAHAARRLRAREAQS